MSHAFYDSKESAQADIENMVGWDAKPVQIYQPDSPHADADGNVWVIEVQKGTGDPQYMRHDGYVR